MDFLSIESQSKAITCVISMLLAMISIYYVIIRKKRRATDQNIHEDGKIKAPEPKGAWPIIGHLLLFGPNDLLYRKLGDLADDLGPAFMIRLGMHRALVVSNWKIAQECFTTNDKIFATRPNLLASKHMAYGGAALGLSPYGPYWREVRKIVMLEILSSRRLHLLRHVRISEIDMSMKELQQLCVEKNVRGDHLWVEVDLYGWFKHLTLNMMAKLIAGKRYYGVVAAATEDEESRRWKKASEELIYLFGIFVVGDVVPLLKGVDVQGRERAMKKTGKEIDAILSKWLEEHRIKKRQLNDQEANEKDFMDVMLDITKDAKISDHDADTVVKATCLALLIAGSDTTMITLTWGVCLLLNNRNVLEKAQAELEHKIGRSKGVQVEEEDIKKLPYLQAIVKETLRLYPAAPLSMPHEAMTDLTTGGFHVPKGTRLITNIWKILRDPEVWNDPMEFRPERFLTNEHANVDFRGQHFEFMPFGSGRRMCPGVSLAVSVIHLTLARLLHEFDLGTLSNGPVDMTESAGLTLVKARPLKVLVTPHLR